MGIPALPPGYGFPDFGAAAVGWHPPQGSPQHGLEPRHQMLPSQALHHNQTPHRPPVSPSSYRWRPGDWKCPQCEADCYASKMHCFRCNAPRPPGTGGPSGAGSYRGAGSNASINGMSGGGSGAVRPGDWTCPSCGANCFASKVRCFRCGESRPAGPSGGSSNIVSRAGSAVRPGDWTCPECGVNCFASKTTCFRCGADKPVDLEGKERSAEISANSLAAESTSTEALGILPDRPERVGENKTGTLLKAVFVPTPSDPTVAEAAKMMSGLGLDKQS